MVVADHDRYSIVRNVTEYIIYTYIPILQLFEAMGLRKVYTSFYFHCASDRSSKYQQE